MRDSVRGKPFLYPSDSSIRCFDLSAPVGLPAPSKWSLYLATTMANHVPPGTAGGHANSLRSRSSVNPSGIGTV